MRESIRILGSSVLRFIEDLCDGSIYSRVGYSTDVHRHWYELSDYARTRFREFLEDVLDDLLDREIPRALGTGRYQVRFNLLVNLPHNYQFATNRWTAVSEATEPEPVYFDTMGISVDSRHFRSFRVQYPMPYEDIFQHPRNLIDYINHIGIILLDHVRRDFFRNDDRYLYDMWPVTPPENSDPNYGRGGYVVPAHVVDGIYDWATFNGAEIKETEEQKQAREKRAEEKRLASQKARELLLDHCNKQQRADYKKNEWFIVKGKKNVYRIRKASQINVDVLDKKGDVKYKLCTVPDKNNSGLPIEDQLLAQKTLIELNEQQFLDIAIRWEVDSPRTEWSWVGV